MTTTTPQTYLEIFQALQIEALQKRNAYLENELKQAKDLFESLITEWEQPNVIDERPNFMDDMFGNPTEQIDNFLK